MSEKRCPYCGKQLIQGYMQSPRPISWTPKRLQLFTERGFTENGACVLSAGGSLGAPCVYAYNCSECKKVIIDYENGDCDVYSK